MKKIIAFVFIFLVVISSGFTVPVKLTKEVTKGLIKETPSVLTKEIDKVTTKVLLTETLEQAAKKSGKVLTPAMREASEKALMKAFKQYGDDVFKVVSHGGLEALEQGSKHGKVFWELCSHSPQAARSLAMHADDLLPIAKRIGPDFMKLETHVPGLAKQAVANFGDDAAKMIVKMSPDDAAKLIMYGSKADSPQTAKLLYEGCQKTSGEILKHLDGKRILALGLSASMITAAYKISNGAETALVKTGDGVEKGLTEIATNSPEQFTSPISHGIKYFFICVAVIVCFILACRTYLKSLVVRSNVHPTKSKDISSEDNDHDAVERAHRPKSKDISSEDDDASDSPK